MAKLQLNNMMISKESNVIHVYKLFCTTQEKEEYKKQLGKYYREHEDGTPLFFKNDYLGVESECTIENGRVSKVTIDLLELL